MPAKAKRKAKRRVPHKRGRPAAGTADWADVFLRCVSEGMHGRDAAKEARIDLCQPYRRRVTDESFGKAWDEAKHIGTKALEDEAARRAYHGTLKPVYQKGALVGHVREYSDALMQFILRARKPKKYREGVDAGRCGSFILNIVIADKEAEQLPVQINMEIPDVSSNNHQQNGDSLPQATPLS